MISKKEKAFEFNLSEILLDLNADYKELNNYINDSGFENAAIKYSISDTSTNGGKIGWVKSSNLSEFIKNQIYNLKGGIFLNQ